MRVGYLAFRARTNGTLAPPTSYHWSSRCGADPCDEVLKKMAKFLLWCILLVLCWPLALIAFVAYPFVWLLLLPFRIVGIAVGGVLELVSAIIFMPVRLVRAI